VRETLGRPQEADRKRRWGFRWFLVLAPVTAAVVVLSVVLTQPKEPLIQVAMLDTAGATRGAATNQVTLLQAQWKTASVRSFDKTDDLEAWEKDWPASKRPVAKVVFDPAAAEVRLLLRAEGRIVRTTFPVEKDLSGALRQAEDLIRKQLGK